jgi:Fur family peroxide stress response transcriptional regulator
MIGNDSEASEERLLAFEEACREHGQRVTIQKRVVYEALLDRKDHPTADEILSDVRGRLPGVSRTSVYRILESLVEVGAARRVCHRGSFARFDPRTERHHHLTCERCGQVRDVESPKLDSLKLKASDRQGFEVRDYSVYFTGICPECCKEEEEEEVGVGRRV